MKTLLLPFNNLPDGVYTKLVWLNVRESLGEIAFFILTTSSFEELYEEVSLILVKTDNSFCQFVVHIPELRGQRVTLVPVLIAVLRAVKIKRCNAIFHYLPYFEQGNE